MSDQPQNAPEEEKPPQEHDHGDYDTDVDAGEPDFEAEEDES